MKTPAVKGFFAAAAAVVLALSAQATPSETPGSGMPLRGMLIIPNNGIYLEGWRSFSSSPSSYAETKYDGGYIYDVGSPRVVNTLGFLTRNDHWGSDRAPALKVYGSNDGTNFSAAPIFSVGNMAVSIGPTVTNYLAREDSPAPAYRYYKATGDVYFDLHLLFFSDEPQLTQDHYSSWPTKQLGEADPETHHLTGKVSYLPSGGTAEVEVLVAMTDHEDDYAAWTADPTVKTFSAGTHAQGEAWSADVTGLATGKWHASAFASYNGKRIRAQKTQILLSGSRCIYPPMYHKKSGGGAERDAYCAYDGNVSTYGAEANIAMWAIFPLEEATVDDEIVAVRYWPRTGGGVTFDRYANVRFDVTTSSDFDFGEVTRDVADTAREVYSAAKEPSADWTLFGRFSDEDYWAGIPSDYFEVSVFDMPRFARYAKVSGFLYYNFNEVEFRGLPRGPMPMATMSLGKVGGTYAGLEGFLDYRGYGCEGCEVYVSCVPEGSGPSYRRIFDSWKNQTDWHGSVTGLKGETHYVLNAIVSNVVGGAGLAVLSTDFTTGVALDDEPPKVESVTVTPKQDGTVGFSWNLVYAGTDAAEADIYVQWGPDAEHLGERHLLRRAEQGLGSFVSAEVPPGEELVFVIVAVNTAGRESKPTAPVSATTCGRSGFSAATAITRRSDRCSLQATGSVSPLGLGTTVVYLVYGGSSGTSETWEPIAQFDASSSSPYTFDVPVTPTVQGSVHCRLVASNGTETASWMTTAAEGTNLLGNALAVSVARSADRADQYNVCDGNLTTLFAGTGTPLVFDLGSAKFIQGFRLAGPPAGNPYYGNLDNLVISSSSDGVAYEPIWSNGGSLKIARAAFSDLVFESPLSARFLSFSCGSGYNVLTEIEIVGDALSIKANPPQVWAGAASASILAKDDPEGIHVSGTIVSGGPAQVWACAAPTDCGADLEAWRRAGVVSCLGEFARGEAITGRLPGAPRGLVYVKLLAVAGNESAVSPIPHQVAVGMKAVLLPAYVYVGSSSGADPMQSAYDGNVGTYAARTEASYGHIFRLDSDKWDVKAVRIWPRSGCGGRTLGIVVEVTDDESEIEATPLVSGERPVFTTATSTCPLTGWRSVGWCNYRMDASLDTACKDIPVEVGRKARYLRVYGAEYQNIGEIEIRAVRRGGIVLIMR